MERFAALFSQNCTQKCLHLFILGYVSFLLTLFSKINLFNWCYVLLNLTMRCNTLSHPLHAWCLDEGISLIKIVICRFINSMNSLIYSSFLGIDTRMKFSIEPPPGDSAFEQWKDAMKAVARLPMGIPDSFRKKVGKQFLGIILKVEWFSYE